MEIKTSFRDEIEEGQRLRGWITNAYAQIEFLLGDLILRCRVFSDYSDETKSFHHSANKRVKQVRAMLKKEGPLTPFSEEIFSVLDRFEERHNTRNLLAHGFCMYVTTPNGETALNFQKFERHPDRDDAKLVRNFRISDLINEERSLVALSVEAMKLFNRIHRAFAWL